MKEEIKILMVDDDEEDFILIRDIIIEDNDSRYSIEWISSYKEGIKVIAEKRHDVYLIDFFLGVETGIDLIKEAILFGCKAPLIILTGQNDFQADQQAMLAGASDYLLKSTITNQSIESSIRYAIANALHKKEMAELNAELEQRVTERTLILEKTLTELERSKEELSKVVKKEIELNEMKSRVISMVSHEFRTPLATILSSLFLITKYFEANDKGKMDIHMSKISSSVNYLTDLLNEMLSLKLIEDGKIPEYPERLNIIEITQHVIGEMKDLKKLNQEIVYEHSGNVEIMQNETILRHLLMNIISNAIKFSEEGKQIIVSTEIKESILRIKVEDFGIGISDNDQKHLFQRFYRASNAENIPGTGIGLSIVSDYLKIINGTVELKSRLFEGTTINIKIPEITTDGLIPGNLNHVNFAQIRKP